MDLTGTREESWPSQIERHSSDMFLMDAKSTRGSRKPGVSKECSSLASSFSPRDVLPCLCTSLSSERGETKSRLREDEQNGKKQPQERRVSAKPCPMWLTDPSLSLSYLLFTTIEEKRCTYSGDLLGHIPLLSSPTSSSSRLDRHAERRPA